MMSPILLLPFRNVTADKRFPHQSLRMELRNIHAFITTETYICYRMAFAKKDYDARFA